MEGAVVVVVLGEETDDRGLLGRCGAEGEPPYVHTRFLIFTLLSYSRESSLFQPLNQLINARHLRVSLKFYHHKQLKIKIPPWRHQHAWEVQSP